jgi:hypothetical protein
MESNGERNRIHVSQKTADLLIEAGKGGTLLSPTTSWDGIADRLTLVSATQIGWLRDPIRSIAKEKALCRHTGLARGVHSKQCNQ